MRVFDDFSSIFTASTTVDTTTSALVSSFSLSATGKSFILSQVRYRPVRIYQNGAYQQGYNNATLSFEYGLTATEAYTVFERDIADATIYTKSFYPASTKCTQNQFDVLVSLYFFDKSLSTLAGSSGTYDIQTAFISGTASNFANILDEDGNVKTVKYNDYTFEEFIDQIYAGLHKFCESELITPTQKDFKKLTKKDINYLINGKQHVFDTDLNLIFNKQHKLFELYDDSNNKIDLSDNGTFMEYFFDEDNNIQPRKQVLLRRMLMGLTSYYPIDRSAIAFMPEIIEPTIKKNDIKIMRRLRGLSELVIIIISLKLPDIII